MDDAGLGAYVRTHREARGLTQQELADLTGVNQATLSNLERGRTRLPTPDHRRRLAAALGVGHVDLLVAAGEVEPDELEDWARAAGVEHQDLGWWGGDVVAQLRQEREGSWRARLASEAMRLTLHEARCVLGLVECMPTEAGRRRRESLPEEDYRQWRDGRDAVEAALERV